jgi:hypothetical protein
MDAFQRIRPKIMNAAVLVANTEGARDGLDLGRWWMVPYARNIHILGHSRYPYYTTFDKHLALNFVFWYHTLHK